MFLRHVFIFKNFDRVSIRFIKRRNTFRRVRFPVDVFRFLACLFQRVGIDNRLFRLLQRLLRVIQRFRGFIHRVLARLVVFGDFVRLVQRGCEHLPAFRRVVRFIQLAGRLDGFIQRRLVHNDWLFRLQGQSFDGRVQRVQRFIHLFLRHVFIFKNFDRVSIRFIKRRNTFRRVRFPVDVFRFLACLFQRVGIDNRLFRLLQRLLRVIQRFRGFIHRVLARLVVFGDFVRLVQRGCEHLPAFRRVVRFIQLAGRLDGRIQIRLVYNDRLFRRRDHKVFE